MDRTVVQQYDVKAGIDYGCWDIHGKAAGLPVHALPGGRPVPRLPLIASFPDGTEDERRRLATRSPFRAADRLQWSRAVRRGPGRRHCGEHRP